MKVKILTAAVSIVSLSWLGMSFATPSEAPEDPHFSAFTANPLMTVSERHPDSHRLGPLMVGEVLLPSWEPAKPASALAQVED